MSYLSTCDLPLLITRPDSQMFILHNVFIKQQGGLCLSYSYMGHMKLTHCLVGTNLAYCQRYLMMYDLMATLNVHRVTTSSHMKNDENTWLSPVCPPKPPQCLREVGVVEMLFL